MKKLCLFVGFSLFMCFSHLETCEEIHCETNSKITIKQDSGSGKDVALCMSCSSKNGHEKYEVTGNETIGNIPFLHPTCCFDDLFRCGGGMEITSASHIVSKFRPQMARIYIHSDSESSDDNVIVL